MTVCVCTIPGREGLIERALLSIFEQTHLPDQVIIEFDVHRTGACAARNRALARVGTEHVAWLDDDDEMLPTHLKRLVAVAAESGADVVYPWYVADPPASDNLMCAVDGQRVSPFGVPFGDEQRAWLARGHNFLHLTALFRTEVLRRVGGFVALGARGSEEDAGVYQALAVAGASFVHVPERTWVWHRGPQGTAGRSLH